MTRLPESPRAAALPLSLLAGALLAACGGDGASDAGDTPAPVSVAGVVADGPLQGATVCYDLNDNLGCDTDEPRATTDADGRYRLAVPPDRAGQHAVVAEVPASAVDRDTGQPVGTALVLRAPPSGQTGAQRVFVSALTTAVAELSLSLGQTPAEAAAHVQQALGLAASPLADFTAADGDAGAAQAATALTRLALATTRLAAGAALDAEPTRALLRTVLTGQLETMAAALAGGGAATPAERAAEAAAAVQDALGLRSDTVAAVATAAAQATRQDAVADAAGPFVSVRRFHYTDASNHGYLLYVGDSSQTAADGSFSAHEVRRNVADGSDTAFNRNQAYWDGSAWVPCARQWLVSTQIRMNASGRQQSALYCGASRSQSSIAYEDIGGRPLRAVVQQIRAYPLADSVGPHTDAQGLPVRWGPDPALLPADAVFPAGAKLSLRQQLVDLGGVDRLELTTKSTVRWPDGRYRQATTLEQYGGMPGDLAGAGTAVGTANTVFVADLPLDSQADPALDKLKRYRAGFDLAAGKVRFYRCDLRIADQASVNCTATGDGTLTIATQGDARLLRVASGYPAELSQRLRWQRFWAERSGTVFRGAHDLPTMRHQYRLNGPAWDALRSALGIAAHTPPSAPASGTAVYQLRSFTFADAGNYSWRAFSGDTTRVDAQGRLVIDEQWDLRSGGAATPFVRYRLYWTGSAWHDCPSDGQGVLLSALPTAGSPGGSLYCSSYEDRRVSVTPVTLAGRRIADVVNDIRAFGSREGAFDFAGWGPNPAVHTQLASATFPDGATMEYRGYQQLSTPIAIATDAANDRVRIAPGPTSTEPFANWPRPATLDQVIAAYPGSLAGSVLNGNTTLFVWRFTETPSSPDYSNQVEVRVAFDANGQKARFTRNNRLVSNGISTNYQTLLDTTYQVETLGSAKVLRFAAMPPGFEETHGFQRLFAEYDDAVWYAYKDRVSPTPTWSIRLNQDAALALRGALGMP